MKNRYIINWELSLKCNLDCTFCSQKERRNNNKALLTENDIFNIIENLPENSHISFLGGETLIYPNIINIFNKLEKKGITYEITTNGILLEIFINSFKELNKLTQINISIDGYGDFHDKSRGRKGLFNSLIKIIPELLKIKEVKISTVITNNSEINLIKLHKELNKIGIKQHKLIYCINFSKEDISKSKEKINSLNISSPGNINIDNSEYKKYFLKCFFILQKIGLDTKLSIEPIALFKSEKTYCKQIEQQYRINEKGKISICEFIDNDFGNLIEEKFEDLITNKLFINLKNEINNSFPLDICKTCCKLCNKKNS